MCRLALTLPLALIGLACRGAGDRPGGVNSSGPASADQGQAAPPSAAGPADPWTIRSDGVGAVTFGMSLAEARAALGESLSGVPSDGSCGFVVPPGAPAGVRFMVEQGKVVRVDVDSSGVRTQAGTEVGMSEGDVRGRYVAGLRVQPHKYDPKGRDLVVQGTAPADSARRLIFETDGERVVRYRAGITPAVEYVEGCA
jgi:hypothetical protein